VTRAAQPVQPARAMIELFVEAYRLHLLRGLEERLSRCGYGLIAGLTREQREELRKAREDACADLAKSK